MLEHDVDVALAGDVPDRLAEAARFLDPGIVFGLRLMTPLAPRSRTYCDLASSETMPMALAPEAATSCTPNTPSPPDAPQTRTLSPGLSVCGGWPNSMR
jgi:hypothetical protein